MDACSTRSPPSGSWREETGGKLGVVGSWSAELVERAESGRTVSAGLGLEVLLAARASDRLPFGFLVIKKTPCASDNGEGERRVRASRRRVGAVGGLGAAWRGGGMLCYVMSCHVMLCYVMLCYVMLCYVMLCLEGRRDAVWPVASERS